MFKFKLLGRTIYRQQYVGSKDLEILGIGDIIQVKNVGATYYFLDKPVDLGNNILRIENSDFITYKDELKILVNFLDSNYTPSNLIFEDSPTDSHRFEIMYVGGWSGSNTISGDLKELKK